MNNNLDNINNQDINGDNIDRHDLYMYVYRFKPIIRSIWKISGVYIIWIFIHFFASHLYVKYCTSYTIIGFITAPILISSPHCVGIRWCITHGASTITAMWIVIGTWFATRLGGCDIS